MDEEKGKIHIVSMEANNHRKVSTIYMVQEICINQTVRVIHMEQVGRFSVKNEIRGDSPV